MFEASVALAHTKQKNIVATKFRTNYLQQKKKEENPRPLLEALNQHLSNREIGKNAGKQGKERFVEYSMVINEPPGPSSELPSAA